MSQTLVELLQDSRDFLNMSTLDKEAGLPPGTVAKIVRGEKYRHLTSEQSSTLEKILKGHYIKLKSFFTR